MEKQNGPSLSDFSSLSDFLDSLDENCILLARHGESDWNASKIIQGQQDRPLSMKGFEQRKNLFFLLQPVSLNRIYCSTLQRTIQTAMPVSMEKKLRLEQRPELNEVKLGIFEGQHKENFSDEFSKNCYQAFLEDEVNIELPGGGESLKTVDKRVLFLVKNILNTAPDTGHVLIVGHRNVNKMIVKNLLGLTVEQGYFVEHKNSWLYVFAPKKSELFLVEIPAPQEPIHIKSGYARIEKYPVTSGKETIRYEKSKY
jgi:broad specificity phosphatase PhoE